ncbi:MAG: DUF58 domain-containing protein, partial [Nitrospirota bacterium]
LFTAIHAVMLSMMVVSGIMSEKTLKGISVARRLPEEIYAGQPFPVRFKVSNLKKIIPSYALAVSELYPAAEAGPQGFLLRLPPAQSGQCSVTEEVNARGEWRITGIEVATKFPFGFFRKAVRIRKEETTLVYPRIQPLDPAALEAVSRGLGEMPARRKGQGADIRGLRFYARTDEARTIHWKGSARSATLLAKEFEAEEKEMITIYLDNRLPDPAGEGYADAFEEAVSRAASIARHVILELERPAALVTRDAEVLPGPGRRKLIEIMEALTLTAPVSGGGDGHILNAMDSSPGILVLPWPGTGWGAFRAMAAATVEAWR